MEPVERSENVDQENGGDNVLLRTSDVIISNLESENGILDRLLGSKASEKPSPLFCQIVHLYENGKILIRVLGTDSSAIIKINQILVNLSYVGAKEKAYNELKRTRESWKPGRPVEVYSRSFGCWCVGYVCKCIELREKRVAHGDLWFQLVYFHPSCNQVSYKQVKFDNTAQLTDVSRYREPEIWEQFHQKLVKEESTHLLKILQERLSTFLLEQPSLLHLSSEDSQLPSNCVKLADFHKRFLESVSPQNIAKSFSTNADKKEFQDDSSSDSEKWTIKDSNIMIALGQKDEASEGTLPSKMLVMKNDPSQGPSSKPVLESDKKGSSSPAEIVRAESHDPLAFKRSPLQKSQISDREEDSTHLPPWESFETNPRNGNANYGSYTDTFNFPANAVMLKQWKAYEREHGFDNLVGACNPPTDHSNLGEPDPSFLNALRDAFTKLRKSTSQNKLINNWRTIS